MNTKEILEFCAGLVADSGNGWSMGTLGVSGEFMRTDDEMVRHFEAVDSLAVATSKGAMRIRPSGEVRVIAYDTLGSDGETWGHSLAFCAAARSDAPEAITDLGEDGDAVREEDRGAALFDLGIGAGLVRMAIRTRDAELISAMRAVEGRTLMGEAAATVMPAVFAAQPHRIMLSPLSRIEVFQNIPPADGKSPEGPHTHVLPRLMSERRFHSSNTPFPEGMQSMLNMHPRSPWRDYLGRPIAFDKDADAVFEALLADYSLPEDRAVRRSVEQAVAQGVAPEAYEWPRTRRGRMQARITLRRIRAVHGVSAVGRWLDTYDRAPIVPDETAELAGGAR